MSHLRRDKRLQGVNNGIRALIPGLRSVGQREVPLDDYVEEALLYCQQAGEWFGSSRKQRIALHTAVETLINGDILGWNHATDKVYVPDETEALFEQIPGRNAGDSSAAAYVAHARILRRLFSLPLKVRTKHQLQWDNIELGCANADLRREKDSSQQECDTMRQRYETLRAERDTLQEKYSELEQERDRLMDAFDAQEVEDRQLQPAAEEPARDEQQVERRVAQGRQSSPQPLAYGNGGHASVNVDPFQVPGPSASTPTGFGVRMPATPFTPTRRPAYRPTWVGTPPSSHNKMRKAQSMPYGTTFEGYYRDQSQFAPPTPVSNPRFLEKIHLEEIREEPPSPIVERVRRATPVGQPVNDVSVQVADETRDPDAMDMDEEDVPQPEPEPQTQSTTSLFDKGKNALYQLATVVTSPIRLLSGSRGVVPPAHHAVTNAASDPVAEPMAVVREPTEEGSESVFNLREHTPSAGFTPPATPPRHHSPFSLRGTERDRRNEQIGQLEAQVADLKEELRDARQYGTERAVRVEELERLLREKQALLRRLVQGLIPAMPAFIEAATHIPDIGEEFAASAR